MVENFRKNGCSQHHPCMHNAPGYPTERQAGNVPCPYWQTVHHSRFRMACTMLRDCMDFRSPFVGSIHGPNPYSPCPHSLAAFHVPRLHTCGGPGSYLVVRYSCSPLACKIVDCQMASFHPAC